MFSTRLTLVFVSLETTFDNIPKRTFYPVGQMDNVQENPIGKSRHSSYKMKLAHRHHAIVEFLQQKCQIKIFIDANIKRLPSPLMFDASTNAAISIARKEIYQNKTDLWPNLLHSIQSNREPFCFSTFSNTFTDVNITMIEIWWKVRIRYLKSIHHYALFDIRQNKTLVREIKYSGKNFIHILFCFRQKKKRLHVLVK